MFAMIDLDNTLADRAAGVSAWVNEFVDAHGLRVDAAARILELDNDGYSDRVGVFETIRREFELAAPVDRLLAEYRERIVELTRLTPGAEGALRSLRARGAVIVIVSNGSSGQQHAKIDRLGLRPLVDAVCISDEVGVAKPDPRIFHAAASSVGRQLNEVLTAAWMIGDSPLHDIAGARRLGIRTAWLRRHRTWTDPGVTPTVTLDSLADLCDRLTTTDRH